MPLAKPKSRTRKKNKKFNFKNPVLIVFILAIIGLGVFIIFGSFASDGEIGAAKLLVSKSQEEESIGDGELIEPSGYKAFSLYDNGLAICGDYPETDKKHNHPYYSKTLTPQERDNFVSSIVATGFMDLKSQYPDYILYSKDTYSITVNNSSVIRKVTAMESVSGLPESYKKTNTIIANFCNNLNVPYEPDEIVLKTKIVPSSIGKKGESALDLEIPTPTDNDIKTQKIKGATAKKLYKTHGKKGEKFSNTPKGVVQSVVMPLLPSAQLLDPNKDLLPSTKSTYSPAFFIDKAQAHTADHPPTKFYRFCPNNVTCPPLYTIKDLKGNAMPSLDTIMNDVNGWYATNIGVAFNVQNNELLTGLHSEIWYTQPHSEVEAYLNNLTPIRGYASSSIRQRVLYNIYYELFNANQKNWAPDSPRQIIYQGSTFKYSTDGSVCGSTPQPPLGLLTQNIGMPSVNFYEINLNTKNDYCMRAIRTTVAHELGHTQALDHLGDDGPSGYQLMRGGGKSLACGDIRLIPNYLYRITDCVMYKTQRQTLQDYHVFVDVIKIK